MASELGQNTENHFVWQFVKGTKFIIPFIINEHSKLFFLSFPSVTNSIILYTVDNIYIYIHTYTVCVYIYIYVHIVKAMFFSVVMYKCGVGP